MKMTQCCVNCFNSETLKEYIAENGLLGNCDFCESNNVLCIRPSELEDYFMPIVNLYNTIENFMPLEDLKNWDGHYIWEALNYDWEIFTFDEYDKQEELVRAILSTGDPKDEQSHLDSYVMMEDDYWGDTEEVSKELQQAWESFCDELKFAKRYFPSKVIDLKILGELLPFSEDVIKMDSYLYRARICDTSEKIHCSQMGKPPIEMSQHGRANPLGIPYLYVASDTMTAIAEKRPFVKDKVTVGNFSVIAPLKVVDLRDPRIEDPFQYGDRLGFITLHLGYLRKLGYELSKTINPKEADLEYIPLQYLCEFIKICGYDGVAYKSSVAEGYNLAVFSDHNLECNETDLYEISNIKYVYEKVE